ncbi:MAG: hypothetical protein AAF620_01325 [Bacteroidota bacterium]
MQKSLFPILNEYQAVYCKKWYNSQPIVKVVQLCENNICKVFDPVGDLERLSITGYWLSNPDIISVDEYNSLRNQGIYFDFDRTPEILIEKQDGRTAWSKSNNKVY